MLTHVNLSPSVFFAIRHCIEIRNSKSIYTYIPKNACSVLRYSIALSNEMITAQDDIGWIHRNTKKLLVNNPQAFLLPGYSFIILRCPYTRLVSVFFDKFLQRKPVAIEFASKYMDTSLESLTFRDFINRIIELKTSQLDHHWRPQVDFLAYNNYAAYFAMEDFPHIEETLREKIGLRLAHGGKLRHQTSLLRTSLAITSPADINAKDLQSLRISQGKLPHAGQMYDIQLVESVRGYYRDDIDLYLSKFGSRDLLY